MTELEDELETLSEELNKHLRRSTKLMIDVFHNTGRPKGFDIEHEWPDYTPTTKAPDFLTKSLEVRPKECECGAKHTSFPDSHLSFCPMKEG